MSTLTIAYAVLLYTATIVFVAGLGARILRYARTPAPFKIPTTPAPVTRAGVSLRMLREVGLFASLFKGNKVLWFLAWLFHMALFVVLLRHLRYFIEPVWSWVALVQPFGVYAGFAMIAGLGGLWLRRLLVPRVRYVTRLSDHLHLLLLIAIAGSGLLMKFVAHVDIVAVKAFMLGLMRFDLQPLPSDPILLIHLGLVAALMIVFPMSKLLHGAAIFFSPTRNQVDDPRERRHLAPWAARLEG